jgi:hypothetical protein
LIQKPGWKIGNARHRVVGKAEDLEKLGEPEILCGTGVSELGDHYQGITAIRFCLAAEEWLCKIKSADVALLLFLLMVTGSIAVVSFVLCMRRAGWQEQFCKLFITYRSAFLQSWVCLNLSLFPNRTISANRYC